jgi:uncharacterized protein with HEPN domain
MRLEIKKYLFDIQQAGQYLQEFTRGISRETYLGNRLVQAAVEREFEIIGEALSQLRHLDPDFIDQITDAPRIIAFRNRLIHGYARIDQDIVWDILTTRLERLLSEITQLLQ